MSGGGASGTLPVGLPLPSGVGRARLALTVLAAVPWRLLPPAPWRDVIAEIHDLARALGVVPRVFGALLWRAATGLNYLRPESDLDLLWPVDGTGSLGRLLDGLARAAGRAPMPIHAEVLTAAGGVQWREFAAARRGEAEVVLVKNLDRVGFVPAAALLGPEATRATERRPAVGLRGRARGGGCGRRGRVPGSRGTDRRA